MLKKAISNKLFSVEFIKADKTKRKMLCKLPTDEKFFAGGELLGNREHLLEVLDVNILKKNKEEAETAADEQLAEILEEEKLRHADGH